MNTTFKARDVDMLVDEEIWGHRIYNEQTPWLCFLEFLNVLHFEYNVGRAFIEHEPNTLSYQPQHRLYLRNILFNNPRLVAVLKETSNDDSRWEKWFQYMKSDQGGLSDTADFRYLRRRFDKFSDFEKMVSFIRSTAIEGDSNKRWSSKFVFPYGPACLYEDLQVSPSGTSVSNDRRFFARTGEVLYLMLCRSQKGPELLPYFQDMLFRENNKWNKIVLALQPGEDQEPVPTRIRDGAYLPVGSREEYENLASDWLHILRCSMPGYDAIPHMVTIMGLHIILYLLNRAKEQLRYFEKRLFVLEIIGAEKNSVHQLATASYRENNRLTQQAVSAYIDQKMASLDWVTAIQNQDIEKLSELFENDFAFTWKSKDTTNKSTAEGMISEFKERASSRHQKHLEKVHGTWGSAIGLSSKRNSRSIRYAPKDMLLKTVVLATVSERMEFQEFLRELYRKYGFVIGAKQALALFDAKQAEQDDFTMNEKRLEDRLASLGLLKRLSDACAYVENPFSQEH
jgi:predicted transcriptional regulator